MESWDPLWIRLVWSAHSIDSHLDIVTSEFCEVKLSKFSLLMQILKFWPELKFLFHVAELHNTTFPVAFYCNREGSNIFNILKNEVFWIMKDFRWHISSRCFVELRTLRFGAVKNLQLSSSSFWSFWLSALQSLIWTSLLSQCCNSGFDSWFCFFLSFLQFPAKHQSFCEFYQSVSAHVWIDVVKKNVKNANVVIRFLESSVIFVQEVQCWICRRLHMLFHICQQKVSKWLVFLWTPLISMSSLVFFTCFPFQTSSLRIQTWCRFKARSSPKLLPWKDSCSSSVLPFILIPILSSWALSQ